MTPSQLVEANLALQKMQSDFNDLVLIERSACIENILGHLDTEERKQVLEFARALATKAKTTEVRHLKDYLIQASIDIDGAYIEKQLENCRRLHDKINASIGIPAYGDPIWGGGAHSDSSTVINLADAKKH